MQKWHRQYKDRGLDFFSVDVLTSVKFHELYTTSFESCLNPRLSPAYLLVSRNGKQISKLTYLAVLFTSQLENTSALLVIAKL